MNRRALTLVLALLALAASPARADEPVPAPTPEEAPPPEPAPAEPAPLLSATVVLIKDRIAGRFEPTAGPSRGVTVVREGTEFPLGSGGGLGEGDAVRCSAGVVMLRLSEGSELSLGEGSQLRIARPLAHRIGTVFYETSGTLEILVSDRPATLEAGAARLSTNSLGEGSIEVLSGQLLLEDGPAVSGGQRLDIGPEGPGEVLPLESSAAEGLALWRAQRFLPSETATAQKDRLQLRPEGGMANLLSANWGRAGFDLRARPAGDFWLQVGASVLLRPGESDEPAEVYWALPIRAGARWIRRLPRSPLYFGLGGDAQFLLFPGCPPTEDCSTGLSVRPGVLAAGLAGVLLDSRAALDIEFSGGIHALAGGNSSSAEPVVIPQVGLSVGLVFRH